jgi:hypothetical protein
VISSAGVSGQKAVEKKSTKEKNGSRGMACPKYAYAFHGTYTSYYALEREGTTCTNPLSIDGENGLAVGNCETGEGCIPYSRQSSHRVQPSLGDKGLTKECTGLVTAAGVSESVPLKKYFRTTDDGTGRTVYCHLYAVTVTPSQFDPPLPDQPPTLTFYIGHEVKVAEGYSKVVTVRPRPGMERTVFDVTVGGNTYQVITKNE